MTIRITQKSIEAAPKGFHRLDDCLYLRVSDSGRSFVFRYMKDGKRRDVGIGSAAKVTVARAKEIALKLRTDIAQGIEPQKKKAAPVVEPVKRERTFNEIYLEAIEVTQTARQWKGDGMRKAWTSSLERFACPIIGNTPLSEINRDKIVEILEPMWGDKTPTASKLRSRLEQVFSYALFKGEYQGQNPALWRGNLDMVLPAPTKIHTETHHEAITLDEAKRVSLTLWRSPYPTDRALLLILLTALRRSEVLRLRWSEVNLVERLIYIPPERRKVARDYPHRVPLSDQAMLLLQTAQATKREGAEYVFESRFVDGAVPDGDYLPVVLSIRVGRKVTVHGCRATFRMWAEDGQKDITAAEYQMMHENPSAVVRAYQRSDLLDRRRLLMQDWADEILPLGKMKAALDETPV